MMDSVDCTRLLDEMQTKLDSTMPWIGMYIAAATLACTLAMAVDALDGGARSRYWLRCKFFSLNAFSLTILAVTMKLPVDLTSTDLNQPDQLARISSLVFMSVSMSNFMTSLGSMENDEIVLNMAALAILVITVTVNVCIHIVRIPFATIMFYMLFQQIASVAIMLLLLATLCSLSLMVPSAKRYIELKYNEMHKSLSNREWGRRSSFDEIRVLVKGYWVMAETSSPQFVVARSAISSTSGLLCLSAALVLAEALVAQSLEEATVASLVSRSTLTYCTHGSSNYTWSTRWIFCSQAAGVMVGSVAPLSRWFLISRFKTFEEDFRDEFKIDKYWTSRLVEWRDTSLPFQVQNRLCKKLLRNAVRLVLNFCIGLQILSVLVAKLVLFLSARFGSAIAVFLCFCRNPNRPDSVEAALDFSHCVLQLEGEAKLPDKILSNICNEGDCLIQIGKKKQPKNLIRLLKKSADFKGVGQFDSSQVPSLHSEESQNCWSLPVVTLTSILVALTSTADDKANQLLASVGEGLSIVKLIEKTLDRNGELESIRKAADVFWIGVEVYRKWDYKDLESTSLRGATHKETLQNLSDIAEKIVTDFMAKTRDILMQKPLNWPVRVIAANSMYRIARTILLQMEDGEHEAANDDEELFERLSITISDIIAACLTNLVQVIKLKCHTNDVKERQESVKRAAILLGESKEILEILQQRQLPSLEMEKAADIDEWRASMAHDIEIPSTSASASSATTTTVEQ